jgi:phage/plasmid-associated DNA primase
MNTLPNAVQYTGPTAADLDRIPIVLKDRPQWVLWRGVDKVDKRTGEIKLTKEPYNACPERRAGQTTFAKASSTNAKTWSTFATVVAALPQALAAWEQEAPADYRGGGIGFVFSPDDAFCGIDLDKCRHPETGAVEPWAQEVIAQVDSYSEASPTETGVHIIAEGELPAGDRKKGRVEMYTEGRYFTITGRHFADTPPTIEARQEAITAVHAAHVARPQTPPPPRRMAALLDLEDIDLLSRAKQAQNGAKFAELWAGETSRYGGDHSRADEALCFELAFWTRDEAQIDRLFRSSGLMREKWDEQRGTQTYGARTIAQALATQTTSYDPEAWLDAQIAAKAARGGQGPPSPPPTADAPPADAPPGEPLTPATLLATLDATPPGLRLQVLMDAMDDLGTMDPLRWMVLKPELKARIPALNMNDLERAWVLRHKQHQAALRAAAAAADEPPGQDTIARHLAGLWEDTTAYDVRTKEWFTYANGIWSPLPGDFIEQRIITHMEQAAPGYTWNTVHGIERLIHATLARPLTLTTPGWLPLRNGALCLETMALHPHTPARPFLWQLPYTFAPDTTCPQTWRWLHETVENNHGHVQLLRAFMKAVVTQRVDLQRYLEILGQGGTGKGTFLRLLTALVGRENVFTTELKYLESNRFETSGLRHKLLMLVTDAERYSGPVNQLKAITGEDEVRMEEKFKQGSKDFAPVLVCVAANEPIQSADYTSGLTRRRISMAFRHTPAAPARLCDWDHHSHAWAGALAPEIPGLLNWVLAMPDAEVTRLIRDTETAVPSLEPLAKKAIIDTNPLADWANTHLIRQSDRDREGRFTSSVKVGIARKAEHSDRYEHEDSWLYPNYRAWVDGTGNKYVSMRRFATTLEDLLVTQLGVDVEHHHDSRGSSFRGIQLRPLSHKGDPLFYDLKSAQMLYGMDTVMDNTLTGDGCDGCMDFLTILSMRDHLSTVEMGEGDGKGVGGVP